MTLIEVNSRLRVGDVHSAHEVLPDHTVRFCVIERPWCCRSTDCLHVHLMADRPDSELLLTGHSAGPDHRIDAEALASMVRAYQNTTSVNMLVHCLQGRERSPLVAAAILVGAHGETWDSAYARLRSLNPRVLDRRDWLQYTR